MDNKYKKIFFFFLILCFFLIKADFVLALEQQYPPVFGLSIGEGTLPEYAKYFFNIGMAIAGTLAAIVIVFGGIYYLVSLGMGKFTDEGKQWIKAGVLGLLLTVSSYLIAYTINPNLVVFKLDGLPIIGGIFNSQPTTPTGPPFLTYAEIPIGTLTENTLSRTIDCYNYDGNGDPIEGQIKTDDNQVINGPTLLNHDRVDCFLKLTEAAEKKSKQIKKLSDEIVKLMETCICEGKCDNTCDITSQSACGPPVEKTCPTGICKGAACKPFPGKSNDCCPPGIKDKIEHGPIKINSQAEKCDYSGKEFKGLDEFRTQLTNISNFVEISPKPKVDGKEVAIINNGNCQLCDNTDVTCQNNRKLCLKNSKWGNLKLIEQLMYLQEKMAQIKSSVEQDRNQLQSAENTLGQCYLAEPYVDFLKTVEKTKKEDKIIIAQKTFNDPVTQKQIDIYKYCKGFDYANSNSYSRCQNICPETMEQNLSCYKGCDGKYGKCDDKKDSEKEICLKSEEACIKNCYNSRPCPAYTLLSTTPKVATFNDCMQGLGQQCLDACDKNYSCSQKDLQKCKESCGDDSKCLLENESKCTVNFLQLKTCANKYTNPDNLKNCINNSFLCKYGSDEYAGYPDCVKNQGQYSSSFLYKNPDKQKCKNPYKPYISDINTVQTCLNLYPETAKCPTASMCPECPCGIIDETINYDSGESGSGSSGGSSTIILEYQVVTGTCNESSYNDDPLTFYCQQNWWNKENKAEEKSTTPIGQEKICSKANEIPVGQTVDDSEKWANNLIKKISDFMITTDEMIQYIKKIGQEQNYCKCDSICENGRPCSSDCEYVPSVCSGDPPVCTKASCSVKPCAGISCQKMINLLKGGSTKSCPVKKDGIFYYYDKIYKESKTFYKFAIVDGRSEILKELSYSRKKMNAGSTVQSSFGKEAKILSCERVQDEIISPIKEGKTIINDKTTKSYCYGKILGKVLQTPEPLADNWFYCEERQGINE